MIYTTFSNYINNLQEKENFSAWQLVPLNRPLNLLSQTIESYKDSVENKDYANMTYMYEHSELRQNPVLLLNEQDTPKTAENTCYMLVFLASYHSSFSNKNYSFKIAQYALGTDYHIVLKKKLLNILDSIKQSHPSVNGRVFVDSAPLFERTLAWKSGLGTIGKNGFLISKKCGVKTLIGSIIFNGIEIDNIPQAESQDIFSYCGNCSKCIEACPTGALYANGKVNAGKCISFHTIENRKEVFPANLNNPDKYLFGCDTCLNACPWNSRNSAGMPELTSMLEPVKELLGNPELFLNSVSSSKFNRIFRESPLQRSGRNKILSTLEVLKNLSGNK